MPVKTSSNATDAYTFVDHDKFKVAIQRTFLVLIHLFILHLFQVLSMVIDRNKLQCSVSDILTTLPRTKQ